MYCRHTYYSVNIVFTCTADIHITVSILYSHVLQTYILQCQYCIHMYCRHTYYSGNIVFTCTADIHITVSILYSHVLQTYILQW